ncbi:unnamed protein product, partial [marine sediment metagenome]
GQECEGTDICGKDGTFAACWDTSTMNPPSTTTYTHTGSYGTNDGGWQTDCYVDIDAAEPYCDNSGNFWCDREDSCLNDGRQTACNKDVWGDDANATDCGYCRTGYIFCDGSYVDADGCEVRIGITNCAAGANNNIDASCNCDCDSGWYDCDASGMDAGNGCERQHTSACTVGALSGTYSCSTGSGGCYREDGGTEYVCTCVIAKSYFQTGTMAEWNPLDNLLWGLNYGDGNMMNFMSYDYNTRFWVDVFAGVHTDGNYVAPTFTGDVNADRIEADFFFGDGSQLTGIVSGGGTVTMDANADERKFLFGIDWNSTLQRTADVNDFFVQQGEDLPNTTLDNNTTAQAWFWTNVTVDSTLDTNTDAQTYYWANMTDDSTLDTNTDAQAWYWTNMVVDSTCDTNTAGCSTYYNKTDVNDHFVSTVFEVRTPLN